MLLTSFSRTKRIRSVKSFDCSGAIAIKGASSSNSFHICVYKCADLLCSIFMFPSPWCKNLVSIERVFLFQPFVKVTKGASYLSGLPFFVKTKAGSVHRRCPYPEKLWISRTDCRLTWTNPRIPSCALAKNRFDPIVNEAQYVAKHRVYSVGTRKDAEVGCGSE